MTAIGCWSATTGLAEAARRSVAAARRVGVQVSLEDIPYWAPTEATRFPHSFRELPRGRLHEIEVCYFNVNEVSGVEGLDLNRDSFPRYVIGSWFWELGFLPGNIVANIELVDEVWAPSGFVRDMLRRHGMTEVSVMPCVVEPVADAGFAAPGLRNCRRPVHVPLSFRRHTPPLLGRTRSR